MHLTVFGATGATGSEVVEQALAADYEVTVVARRPDAITQTGPKLHVVEDDVLAPSSLRESVSRADAVISTLGSRDKRRPTTVYSHGTSAVLAAMRAAGTRRFIGVSAAPVAPEQDCGALERYAVRPLLYQVFGGQYTDMRRMEHLLAASDRDWTVFRPPMLTNKPGTGHYRTTVHGSLAHGWRLPRVDLAAALLDATENPGLIGHTVTVAA